jgi:hypothetical protein
VCNCDVSLLLGCSCLVENHSENGTSFPKYHSTTKESGQWPVAGLKHLQRGVCTCQSSFIGSVIVSCFVRGAGCFLREGAPSLLLIVHHSVVLAFCNGKRHPDHYG